MLISWFIDLFQTEIDKLSAEVKKRDEIISEMEDELSRQRDELEELRTYADSVDQYSRRESLIISGYCLSDECEGEDTTKIVVDLVKDKLQLELNPNSISVSHRLGKPRLNKTSATPSTPSTKSARPRPIIIKLVQRSIKYDLIKACAIHKPPLYINESLTPARKRILHDVLRIRASHKKKFKSCYASEGRVVITLANSTVRHFVTDKKSLLVFLENYPDM